MVFWEFYLNFEVFALTFKYINIVVDILVAVVKCLEKCQ